MNWIFHVPIELRLAAAFAVGACLGAMANWAALRFAWEPRGVNPWIADPHASGRRWWDRIPIIGWLFLRVQVPADDRAQRVAEDRDQRVAEDRDQRSAEDRDQRSRLYGFWIRPLLVELFSAVGLASLYWWEVDRGGLLPGVVPPVMAGLATTLHVQWLCHTVLAWLMLAASLIDADEKLIPDEITVPGTLFGLAAATICPAVMLPVMSHDNGRATMGFLHTFAPHDWPDWLNGSPHGRSLAIALLLWWLWCAALMDRRLYPRWGWQRAIQYFVARLVRSPSTWRLGKLGLLGSAVILGVWFRGGQNWTGLLTSLIGLAAGGGLVWMVRIIGAVTLQREAMGFGDVILMAMIGTVLGWQSCVVIFFLAPLAGLVLGLVQLALRRENEIPYGPFLCLATMVLIVDWRAIWNWLEQTLIVLGGLVPLFIVICLAAMALLLSLWRWVRGWFE